MEIDRTRISPIDWRIVLPLMLAAIAYSDLNYFYFIAERIGGGSTFANGFEAMHAYINQLLAGEIGNEPPQSRMFQVWLYVGIWHFLSLLPLQGLHAIQISLLAVQTVAVGLYFLGMLLFARAVTGSSIASIIVTLLLVQALLSTQFSYPFGGAFREGFFFLGAALAFTVPGEGAYEGKLLRTGLIWAVFFALCATARYDIAMLVALIGFLVALVRRQWLILGIHVGGTVVATAVYRLVRAHVGATDTVMQNFYEVDASGSQLRALLALKNISFSLSLFLLFNVGLLAFWYLRRYCDWSRHALLAATLVYSVFLVFVGSYVEPRLWLPMAGVLMALAARCMVLRRQEAG
jgi:hypothetical protein